MVFQKYVIDLGELNTIERIGSGVFRTVYLVQDKKTNQKYAAKIFNCSEAEQSKVHVNR